MNIQSTKINPSLEKRHAKINELQNKLHSELSTIEESTYGMDEYDPELYELEGFVEEQRVSTHTSELSGWKQAAKVVAGAVAGAALGYQGGKLGAIGNGGLAVAGMALATLGDEEPDFAEMIPGGTLATAAVALPGLYGGVPGAIGGAIAGGLAVVFAGEYFNRP